MSTPADIRQDILEAERQTKTTRLPSFFVGKTAHRVRMKTARSETFKQLEGVFEHLETTAPELVDGLEDFVFLTHEKGLKVKELQDVVNRQRDHNARSDVALLREKDRSERLGKWLAGLNETIHKQRKQLATLAAVIEKRNATIAELVTPKEPER